MILCIGTDGDEFLDQIHKIWSITNYFLLENGHIIYIS